MAGNIQNRYFLVTHTLVHIYTYNYTKGWNQLLNPSCCAYAHRYRSGFNLHSHMYILWLCVSFYCTFWLYCTMHDSSSKLWLLRRILKELGQHGMFYSMLYTSCELLWSPVHFTHDHASFSPVRRTVYCIVSNHLCLCLTFNSSLHYHKPFYASPPWIDVCLKLIPGVLQEFV